ncbi:MAG TPA: hypothetical protein VG602_04290 [Actinomycetota bacterium]|nr:hypothetical protein [Actinomycetota bacterium]
MTPTRRRWATLLPAALVVLAAAGPGQAHDEPTGKSEVHDLAATASGTQVSVTGHAAFGGQPAVTVGEDAAGDSAGGAATAEMGLDFTGLTIAAPNPAKPELLFTMKLAGMEGGGIPELFQYNWDIIVDGGAPNGSNWSIKTMRSQAATGSTNPWAIIADCQPNPQTGGFTCREVARIPVVYEEGEASIRLTVPLARIEASPGSVIEAWARNGEPVWVRTSAAGQLTGFVNADDMTHDTYTVPKSTVRLALAPAGTPEANVDFSKTATLGAEGNFTGTLTAPGPGTYDVWAKACFAENCGTASTPVSIT